VVLWLTTRHSSLIEAHLMHSRAARKNALKPLLLDVDLTHPFLLPNDLDLVA